MSATGVNRFLDADGRVARWPARQYDQMQVLAYLAEQFAPGHSYTEREVNGILNEWHTFSDWSLLRRALVDYGLLRRDPAGLAYQRVSPAAT